MNIQGTAIAYIDGQTLRVIDLAPGATSGDRELCSNPDPLVSHGRADFVAAEEMGRGRGYWWSPDGTSLLVTRVDENPVTNWWIADPAHPERTPNQVRYPAAGTANSVVELEHVGLDGSSRRIAWDDGGAFEYLADVVWEAGRRPLVVRQTRDQRTVSIAEVDLDSLAEAAPVAERQRIVDDIWVELMPGSPRWCSAGLLTIEDGPDSRYLALDGQPLSGDDVNVRSIVGVVGEPERADDGTAPDGAVDSKTSVIVTAWTESTEIHLLRIALPTGDAPMAPERLSVGPGVHGGVVGGDTLVITSASPEQAGSSFAVHFLTGAPQAAGKASLGPQLASIVDRSADPGFAANPMFVELGPDRLPSAVFLPSNHDGGPLPILLDPYGGPHAQRVLKTHNAHLVSRWFAEHGYAVIVTDGRGTPGRGPAWERQVWGNLADPVLDDQVAALDAALDRFDFLDGDRVAIRGWSFGGYLAALAVLRRPDRFHAALAGAPVTTWRLYDTHYTERYLGHPDEHPEHYDRSDLWIENEKGPVLDRLTRPMLLIHGLADDNVVAAHTLRFSTALLATGSPHRVLPLSGVTHMTPQEAVAENLLRLQLSFLDETIA